MEFLVVSFAVREGEYIARYKWHHTFTQSHMMVERGFIAPYTTNHTLQTHHTCPYTTPHLMYNIQVVPPSQHTRKPHHKRTMQRVFCKIITNAISQKTALHWLVRFPNCHEVGWGFPNGEADFALVSINALNYLFHSHFPHHSVM